MISILEVGDWSRDGHNQSELYAVEHNLLSDEELRHAYAAGSLRCGVDLEQVCADYEDSEVSREVVEKLLDCGLQLDNILDLHNEATEGFYFQESAKSFCELYMAIAWLGRPDLKHAPVEDLRRKSIEIGGYGLFYA